MCCIEITTVQNLHFIILSLFLSNGRMIQICVIIKEKRNESIMLLHIKPNSCLNLFYPPHWSHDWNLWIYSSERYSLAVKQHFHCTVCHFVPSTIIAFWLNCCFNMSNHRREYHFYFLLKICKQQICNDFQGVIILHLLFVERNLLFGHICKTLLNDRWTMAEP